MKRALVIVIALIVVGTVGYLTRGWLAQVPVVGRYLGATPVQPAVMWVCPMHPEVRQDAPGTCPKCGMDLEQERSTAEPSAHDHGSASTAGDGTSERDAAEPRVGLSIDLRRQQLIGVRLARVERRRVARSTRSVGLVRYDETRLSDVNLKVEGWIEELFVDYTGQPIRRGQRLFTLYSPDLISTQTEYLLALKTREQLDASRVADARGYADRLVTSARQRLELWDLPAEEIAVLEQTRQPRTVIAFTSPVSGFVIEKRVLKGMRVMPGESLYKVADLSVVWVEADVYERDLPVVSRGMPARVTLDAYPGEVFSGRVTYVYPYVDEQTRTVRLRIELVNRAGRLKPGMYANAELTSAGIEALVVPADAVIDTGRAQFVFVSQGDGYFEPRRVEIGQRLDDGIEVRAGLREGDQVASGATFFIDSESQLRAAMQGFEEAPPLSTNAGEGPEVARVDLRFSTVPDPPRNGPNTFVVEVRDPQGNPVTDAEVRVRLYMAPMPSMNMPAMRSDARLLHAGGGLYRGQGNVSMSGRWDVTVTATRDGERLAQRQLAIVAK